VQWAHEDIRRGVVPVMKDLIYLAVTVVVFVMVWYVLRGVEKL
jgi:hypothetical protein